MSPKITVSSLTLTFVLFFIHNVASDYQKIAKGFTTSAQNIIQHETLSFENLERVLSNYVKAINLGDTDNAPTLLISFLLSLPEKGNFLVNNGTWAIKRLHNPENRSLLANNIAISQGVTREEKDHFWQLALQQDRFSVSVAKNYVYFLEQHGRDRQARDVLRYTMSLSNDWTLNLMEATLCPPHFSSIQEAGARYTSVLTQLATLVFQGAPAEGAVSGDPATATTGAMPLSWAYLGYGMRTLHELLSKAYQLGYPWLAGISPHLLSPLEAQGAPSGTIHSQQFPLTQQRCPAKVRLGVIAEQAGNPSPRKLLQPALSRLPREKFFIVFFQPTGLAESFDDEMRERADLVIDLPAKDTAAWQYLVSSERIDFLLFEALGTNDVAPWLLAHSRLAPVQAVYGHGHPITSGLDNIDYFISSTLFEIDPMSTSTKGDNPHYRNSQEYIFKLNDKSMVDIELDVRYHGDGIQDYTEQVVLFDSLTTYFIEPEAPPRSHQENLLFKYGLDFEKYHIFSCLQHSKKLHPAFDSYLAGVLRKDPLARIVLLEGAKAHSKRWEKSLGQSLMSQLIFIPFMPHKDLLAIVQQSVAALDTFPWGMGVTAFEAFALCTPVVSVPSMTGVLQLTLGQYKILGMEDLIADSAEKFAAIAFTLASNSTFHKKIQSQICDQQHKIFREEETISEFVNFISTSVCHFYQNYGFIT